MCQTFSLRYPQKQITLFGNNDNEFRLGLTHAEIKHVWLLFWNGFCASAITCLSTYIYSIAKICSLDMRGCPKSPSLDKYVENYIFIII